MTIRRRDFLKITAGLGLYSLGMPLAWGNTPGFSDYKALVIVFLDGGNDGINSFIPIGSDNLTGYRAYRNARETLAVADIDLMSALLQDANGDLELDPGSGNPFYNNKGSGEQTEKDYLKGYYAHANANFGNNIGTHALMPEIAHFVRKGKVAIIQNVGHLTGPTTKQEIESGTAELPPFLMAHNHQATLLFNGSATRLRDFGWAGRLADAWQGVNGNDIYGMNIGFYPVSHIITGQQTNPVILGSGGLSGFDSWTGSITILKGYANHVRSGMFRRLYNERLAHAYDFVDRVRSDWSNYDNIYDGITDPYGKPIKTPTDDTVAGLPHGSAGDWDGYFLAIPKLVKIGIDRGLKRQIFYIRVAHWDTHGGQKLAHGRLMRRLSISLGKMQKMLDELGLDQQVTTLPISEFGRSLGANGDGTDHAWGNHMMVIGGAVKGGLYGAAPSLELGGDDDMTQKGRLIPTTSTAQMYNTVLRWFGADAALRQQLFPDIVNFAGNEDLDFMT